jgi:hypothetical protein
VDVDVYPIPTINTVNPFMCATSPNRVDTFDVVGAGGGSTYSWVLSPDYGLITGSTVDSASIYVTFPPGIAATYSFTVIVTDGVTGCVDTVSTSFTVTAGLNMNVTGPSEICVGEIATLVANGAATYAWTANPSYAFADSTQASQDVSPVANTVFTIYGETGTCAQVITDSLTINPLPTAVAAGIPDFCGCDSVNLDGTGSSVGMNYLWTNSASANIADTSSLVTTATLCSSDVFTLTVTDPSTGCFASDISNANSLPKPDAAALVSPVSICVGSSTSITLDGTGSDVSAGTTYLWTCSDPSVVIAAPNALITNATVSNAAVF